MNEKLCKKQHFGTDGIRGRVGTPPITPDFMLKLGWAAGSVFAASAQAGAVSNQQKHSGRSTVLIGKDTRISGYMFEAALEAGLTAAGVDIKLTGPMPTPAIAYLTRTLRAQAGIVISASHNSFEDNGIKFFAGDGSKLPDETELAIEAKLQQAVSSVAPQHLGRATRLNDAAGRYIEFCKSSIGSSLRLDGLKLVLDCAHGSTYHIAPAVFAELGAKVTAIGVSPDGLNINEARGSTSPAALQEAVLAEGADLGIAFDGDGDRVIMVNHKGQVADGDDILYVIAAERKRRQAKSAIKAEGKDGVVGTAMSNLGLELALQELKIPFTRSAVGDRYVMAEMQRRGWRLGGESSGHILCLDITTTGDGIVSALQALSAMARRQKSLADLTADVHKLPQCMVNVRTIEGFDVDKNRKVQSAVAAVESRLGNSGRVLLRASGTEPVVRVMVEGEDQNSVHAMAQELSAVVSEVVAEEAGVTA